VKTLSVLLLMAICLSTARCIAKNEYWNHQQMIIGGITYNPYEQPVCVAPNGMERLFGFPPKCHFRSEE